MLGRYNVEVHDYIGREDSEEPGISLVIIYFIAFDSDARAASDAILETTSRPSLSV